MGRRVRGIFQPGVMKEVVQHRLRNTMFLEDNVRWSMGQWRLPASAYACITQQSSTEAMRGEDSGLCNKHIPNFHAYALVEQGKPRRLIHPGPVA
jgi:hypothetical protein